MKKTIKKLLCAYGMDKAQQSVDPRCDPLILHEPTPPASIQEKIKNYDGKKIQRKWGLK